MLDGSDDVKQLVAKYLADIPDIITVDLMWRSLLITTKQPTGLMINLGEAERVQLG